MRVYPNPAKIVNGSALKVKDPERDVYLPRDGNHVPRNTYWLRRLACRDVMVGVPPFASPGAAD